MIICNRKEGQYSDHGSYEMLTLNEIRYTPAKCTSTFLSAFGLAEKDFHTQSMLLRFESNGRYKHHKQVKVNYYHRLKHSF
jgi:hypothetical protein